MQKRVVDLTFEELSDLASQAGAEAVREAFAAGLPVTGKIDGYDGMSTMYPDGTVEPFDRDKDPRPAASARARQSARRRAAAVS